MWILMIPVTWSQSAAVPAPQQKMLGAKLWSFSQFLSPTIEPPVALVSPAKQTPSYKIDINTTGYTLKITPQIVVPVFIDLGGAVEFYEVNAVFLRQLS
jgi:hypothetical protein